LLTINTNFNWASIRLFLGKSTIICGICLALGGNPKLLGRSEKMADYVKHDERTASVEVHMKTGENDEVVIIRLVIHSNNKHNFFINDQQVNKSELIRLVSSYNIQVDNPCVFLAQDKVKSFAEQNPVALLENTEKACSIELQETHDELKNLSEHDIGRGKRKEDCEKNLKSIEKELKALSSRVENFLRKEGMQKRIESLQQREIFIICEREERTLEKHQVEMNKAEQKVSEVETFVVFIP
uniref:Structural maintenance of chromosomes protein 5 n=1 Tax=Anisakis simplex TaxID=6269 RepID=A0A0M3KHD8_ANISI